jgi:hypothetical protein
MNSLFVTPTVTFYDNRSSPKETGVKKLLREILVYVLLAHKIETDDGAP